MAAAAWTPDPHLVGDIVKILKEAESPDTQTQRRLAEAIARLEALPEAPCYFCFILSDCSQEGMDVRQRAGLLLKSRIAAALSPRPSGGSGSSDCNDAGKTPSGAPAAVAPTLNCQALLPILDYVKRRLMKAVCDNDRVIRMTAATALTTLIRCSTQLPSGGPAGVAVEEVKRQCQELLPFLFQLLDHPQVDVSETAFQTITMIVEDEVERGGESRQQFFDGRELGAPGAPAPPAATPTAVTPFLSFCGSQLIPKLLTVAAGSTTPSPPTPASNGSPPTLPRPPSTQFKIYALTCLNLFQRRGYFSAGDIFHHFFDAYWKVLGTLAVDDAPKVRQLVMNGILQLSFMAPEIIIENLGSLVPFTVTCLNPAQPYEVKLEAAEFLPSLMRLHESRDAIFQHLDRLLPALVENARYSEWDYMQMDKHQLENDNAVTPDGLEDVAPQFASTEHFARGGQRSGGETNDGADDDEDDDGGENDIDGMPGGGRGGKSSRTATTWGTDYTLRKASAMIIDCMAATYGNAILPYVLPLIEARLQDSNWESREAAVLTVGAIAPGCLDGLQPFLPKVINLLLGMCNDSKPILRSINVWAVSRFAMWISPQPDVLKIVTHTILCHVLDRNKRVQEAACSAFACLCEEAREALEPFLPAIVDTFGTAFRVFQTKNIMALLDAVGTTVEALGPAVDCPLVYEKIVDPLLQRLNNASRNDPSLIVLYECTSCVVLAIRQGLKRYAPVILDRCICTIHESLAEIERYAKCPETAEEPRRDLIESALDVLSALCEGLGRDIGTLIAARPYFFELLEHACKIDSYYFTGSTIKQGCFALIGDLAEQAPDLIAPAIPRLVPQLVPYIASGPAATSHNASWAIGQLALHTSRCNSSGGATGAHGGLEPFVEVIGTHLSQVIPRSNDNLVRNASTTMGRLALVYPRQLAGPLAPVFGICCRALERSSNDQEKVVAIKGFCHLATVNPTIVLEHLPNFLDAIASLYVPRRGSAPPPPPPPSAGVDQQAIAPADAAPSAASDPRASTGALASCVSPDAHTFLVGVNSWFYATYPSEWREAVSNVNPHHRSVLTEKLLYTPANSS